jgi:hypothetical protein
MVAGQDLMRIWRCDSVEGRGSAGGPIRATGKRRSFFQTDIPRRASLLDISVHLQSSRFAAGVDKQVLVWSLA